MASYKIAVASDGKTYHLVKVTAAKLIVICPQPNLIKKAHCSCVDDILNLAEHKVTYAPDYAKIVV